MIIYTTYKVIKIKNIDNPNMIFYNK